MTLGNVLVIRPGALGDALLTLPALSALHEAGAQSLTVLGTPSSFAFLRRDDPSLRVVDFSSSGWLGLFAAGAALSNDAAEILKRTQSAVLYLNGDTLAIEQKLASLGVETILRIDPPVASGGAIACHAARCLLNPLAPLVGDYNVRDALDPARIERLSWLVFTAEELQTAREFLATSGGSSHCFAAIHPGSGGRKKCWPAARFAELAASIAREMDCEPLVFFGPADDQVRREFEAAMPSEVIWRAIAHRPLREVLALLYSCAFYVGNDSGMSHLAARAVPTLAIFGPTDPDVWAPIGENVSVVTAANRDLNLLAVETVLNAVLNLKPDKSRARQ